MISTSDSVSLEEAGEASSGGMREKTAGLNVPLMVHMTRL